jgi:hypothetical protein
MTALPQLQPLRSNMHSDFVAISIVVGFVTFGVLLSLGLRLFFDRIHRNMRLRKERAAAQRREGFEKFLKSIRFYLEADGETEKGARGRYRVH